MVDSTLILPAPLVETAWLAEHLGHRRLRILDCSVTMRHYDDGSYDFASGRKDWEQVHIPGSDFVDVLGELSDPDHRFSMMMPPVETFAAILSARGVGDRHAVVLYDRSNHAWAARVWWMLRVCGFDNAAVLNGGWNKWVAEDRETTDERVHWTPATLTPHPRPGLMAAKRDVQEALSDPGTRLVHALSPESFRGEVELFPRPGRIPGSGNVFCQALVDPQTLAYVDPREMRRLFAQAGALDADRVITYCGAGIAASSDALALTFLGVANVAVYDGSMEEWTADPDTPLETG